MGAKLAGAAYAFAALAELTPNERMLLVWMALRAMDNGEPPRYFGSREDSALALGRIVPDAPDVDDPNAAEIIKIRQAAFQRVKTATQGLVRAGAIEHVKHGGFGQRAEYSITLSRGTSDVPHRGMENDRQRVVKRTRAGLSTYPQEQLEQEEELQEQHPDPALTHLPPVEKKQRVA